MFTKRRIYQLLATVITFFLGTVFQSLLDQWLHVKDLVNLALIAIIVTITFVLTILLEAFSSTENKFEKIENKLENIIRNSIIKIEYIEDDFDGKSYKKSTELIEKAKTSITFVSPWEPATEFQPGMYSDEVGNAKRTYYKTIRKQIESSTDKDALFHRRILQVPPELFDNPSFSFTTDSSFVDYLHYAAEAQIAHPRVCHLKMVSTMLGTHFTIIDNRYVILSVMGYLKDGHRVRQGEVIIEDGQGELVKYYNLLYQTLESPSRRLEPHHFKSTTLK